MTWENITKEQFFEDTEEIVTASPEQARVISLLKELLPVENFDWYFSECHNYDEDIEDKMAALKFNKVYDSCYIDWLRSPSGYNIIHIASDEEYWYLAISLNGSSLASALTEYVRFKKYPDQVDPADEDHIYFNADPEESENGVTGPAEYYDEHGL
mgnify:FL=1|jgi:hypothetical protein